MPDEPPAVKIFGDAMAEQDDPYNTKKCEQHLPG
jgi:hypothetical protein